MADSDATPTDRERGDAEVPRFHYPEELPVSAARDEIAAAIRDHQVVIVAGATGSGKTTQLPKICLELGRNSIGHTQPRRIAARTIAERIAEELGTELGGVVGYQVRFTDRASDDTRIKVMTDGILLAELRRDRLLRRYDTIIIDEAHERSLNIDFLLGYLKRLLPKRPDLKIIITSATIDPESFARHFASPDGTPAPVIEVSGRTFPVEVRYRPLVPETDEDAPAGTPKPPERDVYEGIVDALRELDAEDPGDVLVFLPGEREIRDAQDAINDALTTRERQATEVLPLYGRLSAADQHRIFEPGRKPGIRRRVVLATNVAETSLTVPGIAYVIDAGLARISRYSVRSKVQRLPIEAVSQASANQRSGRSGRTRPGIAIRLFSEEDFERRELFTEPEILRTNLASVLLQMLELRLGDIKNFPFLTPPDSRGVAAGTELLRELGAITTSTPPKLTKIGRELARLPIEPRFGRMLLAARELGVAREVLVIVAGLTVADIRERPLESRQRADELHTRFADPTSDFLTLLRLWDHLEERSHELGSSALRREMKSEFLNMVRWREWQDLHRQLREIARELGMRIPGRKPEGNAPDADRIHQAMLAGLLSHIGVRDEVRRDYLGARGTRFRIFPGSTLAKRQPEAVMAAELVETSALFARQVAQIDPAWAESLAGELVKRRYADPHWERKQGQAVINETATLYGIPLVRNRRVGLAKIDPEHARDLFIEHALVEGDWSGHFAFERTNRQLRRELGEVEERTRQRGLIEHEDALIEFFQERIPEEVVSQPTFERWWRKAQQQNPKLLHLRRSDLVDDEVDLGEEDYPRDWHQGDQRLRLRYRFDPGANDDGITATVPLALLASIRPEGFDWLVPGLRTELVVTLVKSLPKAIRRNFVPAADWAPKLLTQLDEAVGIVRPDLGDAVPGPFMTVLREQMQRAGGIRFRDDDFDLARVPSHLRMRFRVTGDDGRELASGEDLTVLQEKLKRASEASLVRASRSEVRGGKPATEADTPLPAQFDQQDLSEWPGDDIPESFELKRGRGVIRAYPALKLADPAHPASSRIDLVLATTQIDQETTHADGVAALISRALPSPASYIQAHLTAKEKLSLGASPYRSVPALFDELRFAIVRASLPEAPVRSRSAFEATCDRVNAQLVDAMFDGVRLVADILTRARDVTVLIKRANAMTHLGALTDARAQLNALVFDGFIARTGLAQLRQLPRYLQALAQRLERLDVNPQLERAGSLEIEQATQLYRDAGGALPLPPQAPAPLVEARWMLEELRVSLFAQQLGTAQPVSVKRLRKVLAPAAS